MTSLLRSKHKNQLLKKNIQAVFQKMDEYSFKLGSEKCEFFMKQIKYLGQIIGENDRRSDSKMAETLKNMPSPNNVANLLAFFLLGQLL